MTRLPKVPKRGEAVNDRPKTALSRSQGEACDMMNTWTLPMQRNIAPSLVFAPQVPGHDMEGCPACAARRLPEGTFVQGDSNMRCALLFVVALFCAGNAASAQTVEGRLKQIGETRVVKLAYRSDANPFSFVDPQGQPDGYSIDLCKSIVHSLELQLNAKLAIAWVAVDTRTRFDAIANGLADMECGSSTVSFARMAKVDFSSFIFMENTGLVVRTSSGIFSIGDMGGKKIAVIVGTTNETALVKELQRRQLQTELVRVKDREEGMAALQSAAVDGFASDKLLLIGAQNADAATLKMLPENLSYEPYAIALPRGDWAFRIAVNRGLSQLYGSPQILDIYLKWFAAIGQRPDLLRAAVYIFGTFPE
jgi:glutamate/aspartate transport system substrate-binding protein